MRTINSEFPDYDDTSIAKTLTGFKSEPWCNDACPCFTIDIDGIVFTLFADYVDPEKREMPCERFTLSDEDNEFLFVGETLESLWSDARRYANYPECTVVNGTIADQIINTLEDIRQRI